MKRIWKRAGIAVVFVCTLAIGFSWAVINKYKYRTMEAFPIEKNKHYKLECRLTGEVTPDYFLAYDNIPSNLRDILIITFPVLSEEKEYYSVYERLMDYLLLSMRDILGFPGFYLENDIYGDFGREYGDGIDSVFVAQVVEKMKKKEGVELILNKSYFGGCAFGVKRAARRYFEIEIERLNDAQAAFLAAILLDVLRKPFPEDGGGMKEFIRNKTKGILKKYYSNKKMEQNLNLDEVIEAIDKSKKIHEVGR